MTYPSLVREDKFRDILEVVKVEDSVDGRPRVHERESALLFGRDLLDDLLDGAGIDGAEAEWFRSMNEPEVIEPTKRLTVLRRAGSW